MESGTWSRIPTDGIEDLLPPLSKTLGVVTYMVFEEAAVGVEKPLALVDRQALLTIPSHLLDGPLLW